MFVALLTDDFNHIHDNGVQERIRLSDVNEESRGIRENELDTRNLLATQDTEGADESSSVGGNLD